MTRELLNMKCYNCGSTHCTSVLCLEQTNTENEEGKIITNYSFGFTDRSGISRSIFVSKEDMIKLSFKLKEILTNK